MASTYTNVFTSAFPKKRIVYDMSRTADGWRLSAYVPSSAPAADRMTVVRWLGDYKKQVKKAQPNWIVQFKVEDNCHYQLKMTPTNLFAMNTSREERAEALENAWEQLSFDYA